MGAATDLYDLADEILGVCCAALTMLPAGCPERSYVGHGLPALDCEQLVVSVYQPSEADTSPRTVPLDRLHRAQTSSLNVIFLVASLVRCYPTIRSASNKPVLPTVAELTAASQEIYADGWQLWNALKSAKRAGAFDGLCSEFGFTPALPIQPQGGYAGWTIPIEAALAGFTVEGLV